MIIRLIKRSAIEQTSRIFNLPRDQFLDIEKENTKCPKKLSEGVKEEIVETLNQRAQNSFLM